MVCIHCMLLLYAQLGECTAYYITDDIALRNKIRTPKKKLTFTKFKDLFCRDSFIDADSVLPILGISNNPL